MNKKLILTSILFLALSIATVSVLILEKQENGLTPPFGHENTPLKNEPAAADGKIVLFYGDGCPHCLKVEAFLDEKNAPQKISYETKEVWSNADNRKMMMDKVVLCKMEKNNIGVPFLWNGENSQCLMGEDQIIDFFQKKLEAAAK